MGLEQSSFILLHCLLFTVPKWSDSYVRLGANKTCKLEHTRFLWGLTESLMRKAAGREQDKGVYWPLPTGCFCRLFNYQKTTFYKWCYFRLLGVSLKPWVKKSFCNFPGSFQWGFFHTWMYFWRVHEVRWVSCSFSLPSWLISPVYNYLQAICIINRHPTMLVLPFDKIE